MGEAKNSFICLIKPLSQRGREITTYILVVVGVVENGEKRN